MQIYNYWWSCYQDYDSCGNIFHLLCKTIACFYCKFFWCCRSQHARDQWYLVSWKVINFNVINIIKVATSLCIVHLTMHRLQFWSTNSIFNLKLVHVNWQHYTLAIYMYKFLRYVYICKFHGSKNTIIKVTHVIMTVIYVQIQHTCTSLFGNQQYCLALIPLWLLTFPKPIHINLMHVIWPISQKFSLVMAILKA